MQPTVFDVRPVDGRWQIDRDGEVLLVVQTKDVAIEEARIQASKTSPSDVVVHDADEGEVEEEDQQEAS